MKNSPQTNPSESHIKYRSQLNLTYTFKKKLYAIVFSNLSRIIMN